MPSSTRRTVHWEDRDDDDKHELDASQSSLATLRGSADGSSVVSAASSKSRFTESGHSEPTARNYTAPRQRAGRTRRPVTRESNVAGGESATRGATSELDETVKVADGTTRSRSSTIENGVKALLCAVGLLSWPAQEEKARGDQEAIRSQTDHSES